MKKIISIGLIICMFFAIIGCGSNEVIDGKKIESIGLINIMVNDRSVLAVKEPGIKYEVMWENVVVGIILIETAVMPIYIFGFELLKPVGPLTPTPASSPVINPTETKVEELKE
jgi:hypothetical protein